jgi:hypothetical protein
MEILTMNKTTTNQSKTPEQTLDTAKASNTPTRAKASRKIDAEVIAQMAQAVATMLTESEAARRCGIEPRHWFEWKSRAGRAGKFAALLEEFRANKIAGLLDRVQKSADGVDVKFPDFRAALALLKFQDRARFGDSPTVEINTGQQTAIVIAAGGEENLRKLIGSWVGQAQVAPPAAPKQLAAAVDVEAEREK